MPSQNIFDLTGKVAAIVGSGSGIGEAVALGAARAGARVTCLDLKVEAVRSVAARARAEGLECDAAALDIRDPAAVDAAMEDVRRAKGSLDVVVCTPAVNVRKKILDYQDDELDRVVDLNLKGNFYVLRAAGRIMTADRRGSIVLFSSVRSVVVEPGQSVYAATKAGIVQMVRAAASEFGPYGVRVNSIGPGVIETPLTAPIKQNAEWYNAYAMKNPMQRWAQASEMAGPTIFLLSDAASYVTGTILYADGGWLAADGRFTPPGM